MNLQFHIDYQTYYGQELVLNMAVLDKKGTSKVSAYRMQTADGLHWEVALHHSFPVGTKLNYFYSVDRGELQERREWGVVAHRLDIDAMKGINYRIYDHWIDIPEDSYMYTSAITDCVVGQSGNGPKATPFAKTVSLKVRAPQLRHGDILAVVGADAAIGAWDVNKSLRMNVHQTNEWIVEFDASHLSSKTLEFKFVIVEATQSDAPMWEEADNRTIEIPLLEEGDVVVYELDEASFPIPPFKLAGTLVPVFSLRSKNSFGVGDFGDLKKMIEWVAKTHQRVLQVLPINDTTTTHTWTDSYPYSCISIFALHPQYVDLTLLPSISDEKKRKEMEVLRKELNALEKIDYERVNDAKIEYLKIIFEQEGQKVLSSKEFKTFFAQEESWLVPYAQYCYLRDSYGSADISAWKGHEQWHEEDRKALSSPRTKEYKEVSFWYFVQYILCTQMSAVHDFARSKGVILKGDIPIGVNRNGCDVWTEPRYFNLNGQAGAPPDDFSVNGQNWGFPTYNWEEMIKDGCQWWVRRFQNMAHFFDAYRIDHVLGFFRIWEIPLSSVHGLLGQFQPSLGMSKEEIEGYGLHWQEELFTTPFITDWVLDRVFHDKAGYIRETYLDRKDNGHYRMKPALDTQRKLESYFEKLKKDKAKDIKDENELAETLKQLDYLRDGLYSLISDVLFVRDHKDKNKFHPRISVQFDFIYESLYDSDKYIFNKLYNDYYYRRNNHFWYREAMRKLPKLTNATRMLVCAEDLGMVPDCVSWVMDELKILSLELQSMPKDPSVRFGYLSRNPYRSVCTISSHDMPTLRQWWDEDFGRTQAYYNEMLHRGGPAPHPLPGWLARDIISRHLASPSMLCVLSIQDWLSIDEKLRLPDQNAERINIPANPKHYWRYRMHIGLEELMSNADFTANVSELVTQEGRG